MEEFGEIRKFKCHSNKQKVFCEFYFLLSGWWFTYHFHPSAQQSEGVIRLQSGSNKGATQAGINFGKTRTIMD